MAETFFWGSVGVVLAGVGTGTIELVVLGLGALMAATWRVDSKVKRRDDVASARLAEYRAGTNGKPHGNVDRIFEERV